MACFGSKTLRRTTRPSRTRRSLDVPEEEGNTLSPGERMKMKKGFKKNTGSSCADRPESTGPRSDPSNDNIKKNKKKKSKDKKGRDRGRRVEAKDRKFEKNPDAVSQRVNQPSVLRKKVDPETAKYFSEIANLFESNAIDVEERPSVCANALDEARGKELALATDMVISRTLQTLLEGSELEQVCAFLWGCAVDFCSIAMDRYGSHVVESALKSLSQHLEDVEAFSIVEDTLSKLCKVVAVDPVNIVCNCYGSHVVRSLICLCNGASLDSLDELHSTKKPSVLAGRLNIQLSHHSGDKLHGCWHTFPDLLKRFISEMLRNAGTEIKAVRVDKYGSFVLQVALKSLVGDDQELTAAIFLLLGCSEESILEGVSFELVNTQEILELLKDTAASHLMEVILEVAPGNLYDEFFKKIFRGSLYEISSHQCGNFAVQALISSARSKGQVDLIWEELSANMKDLLEIGKAGVIASLLAACHRLETHAQECCTVLAHAVHSENEHSSSVVPRLLFLDSFLRCKDKSTWQWPLHNKMHILGCLMLQTIFKLPNQCMQQYAKSLVSMETDQILKMADDDGGSRVLESFLSSDAPTKVKLRAVSKLQGYFGKLSLHPSGSFTVEKCFSASNLSLREKIVIELSAVRDELAKTKHGPHVIKKLDVERFVRRPDQWKSSQATKDAVYREFQATFGSQHKDSGSHASLPLDSSVKENRGKGKRSRSHDKSENSLSTGLNIPDIDISMAKLGFPDLKLVAKQGRKEVGSKPTSNNQSKKFVRTQDTDNCFVRGCKKRKTTSSELADLAGKRALSSGDMQKLFDSALNHKKNRY